MQSAKSLRCKLVRSQKEEREKITNYLLALKWKQPEGSESRVYAAYFLSIIGLQNDFALNLM